MLKVKFDKSENEMLSEIYRRLNYFHDGNINENLLLLSTPSRANILCKYQLIKPFSREIPRALNWYNLTEKGKLFFSNYITKNKLSADTNLKLFTGEYVKSFDFKLLNT